MTEVSHNLADGISDSLTGTTTNDYAYGLKWIPLGLSFKTIHLKNTDGANALKYKVLTLAYHNGIEYEEVSETGLAVGDMVQIILNHAYACVKVHVKSSVADSHAAYQIDYTGDKG